MCPDHPPPPGRRYSDEEFRWILDRATREPGPSREGTEGGAQTPPAEGLSLNTIREIAREVGIPEAAVDRAAASLEDRVMVRSYGDPEGSKPGAEAGYRADFRVPRRLTEAEMRMLLLEAERILGGAGTRERMHDGIRWRDAEKRMQVEIVRGSDATEVRASANTSNSLRTNSVLIGALGLGGITSAWMSWPESVFVLGPFGLVATGAVIWFYRLGVRVAPRGEIRRLLEELRVAVSLEGAGGSSQERTRS